MLRESFADTDIGLDLDATVYALDSTPSISAYRSSPGQFRKTKAAIKLHNILMKASSMVRTFMCSSAR